MIALCLYVYNVFQVVARGMIFKSFITLLKKININDLFPLYFIVKHNCFWPKYKPFHLKTLPIYHQLRIWPQSYFDWRMISENILFMAIAYSYIHLLYKIYQYSIFELDLLIFIFFWIPKNNHLCFTSLEIVNLWYQGENPLKYEGVEP